MANEDDTQKLQGEVDELKQKQEDADKQKEADAAAKKEEDKQNRIQKLEEERGALPVDDAEGMRTKDLEIKHVRQE